MFTIGQFSRITGLPVKTIRLYHEEGLLVPARVDPATGYRGFDARNVEQARRIRRLRELSFPLAEIRAILEAAAGDDGDLVAFLERRRSALEAQAKALNLALTSLDDLLRREREAKDLLKREGTDPSERTVEPVRIATVRWKGRYEETGRHLGRVARTAGRHVRGAPFNLYWDGEFKEQEADIESGFPVADMSGRGDVVVRTLPGGPCAVVLHRGPYEFLGRSYQRLLEYVQERGFAPAAPVRETYVKGPGVIFKGDPRKYLTEILVPLEGRTA